MFVKIKNPLYGNYKSMKLSEALAPALDVDVEPLDRESLEAVNLRLNQVCEIIGNLLAHLVENQVITLVDAADIAENYTQMELL